MKKRLIFFIYFMIGMALCEAQIFTWKNPNLPKDSTKIDSVLAQKYNGDFFKKDTADFVRFRNSEIIDENLFLTDSRKKILGDLDAKGSVVRGITFGNSQGTSVQSAMDMQISGRLSKDVTLLASISDHKLPIQADGYTQTLEEFDKVYMQLNIRDKTILRAGHIDLTDNSSFFGKYQRRTMGLEFSTSFGKNNLTHIDFSAGVARSEFHRQRFQAIEGNQGPYRLKGKNGENFITIISGSEQVFIDGILMKRGENLDYVINYNTGELTFTSFRPVYRQNFITVSYNYTNRNYSRYLVTGAVSHQNEKFRYGLNVFLENDNKSAPLSLNLSKEDQQILASAGNDSEMMYAPSAVLTDFDVNKILYRRLEGPAGAYYEFSTNQGEALYQVSFTYFGSGRGDYNLKQTTNNGRIFEYVGANLGDYSPLRKLPSPQKSQVLSGNFEYKFNTGSIGADASLSNYDLNLFSSKDNSENVGYAARIFGNKTFQTGNWKNLSSLQYQHIDRRFHILDRINDVEFARDFNLVQEFSQRTQDRLTISLKNSWKNQSFLNYYGNLLNEKDFYRGIKNDLDFGWITKKIITKGNISYLDTKSDVQNTNFTRGSILSEYMAPKARWGVGAGMEHNVKKLATANQFDNTSYSWKEVFAQVKIGDSLRTKLFAKAYFRDNDSVWDNRLTNANRLLGLRAESQIIKNEKTQLSALLHYRRFFNQMQSINTQNQDFLIGNLLYSQQLFRNGMRLQAFYELGNGQEAQREFQYIKVTDGQGVYKWTDYNGDGVQQLDEFETAEYLDQAKYIRIYTNTIHYIPSNKNKLQLSLFMAPATVFNSQNAFLKRWNANLSLFSQNSFYKKDRVVMLNPFANEGDQILKNQTLLAAVQFNPTDQSGWNGSYRYSASNNIINANLSREENLRSTHLLNVGYWFNKSLRADWENSVGNQSARSQLFNSRNYEMLNYESKPKLTYKFSENTQAEAFASYRDGQRTDGAERLKAMEVNGTLQWERRKTSIRGSFSFINNDFSGESFSIVGNQMLDGLKPGKNQVWNLYIQQALNAFISLNINYEGRNSGERTIHIGSMQVKASF